jgi:hypothetical protein
MCGWRVVDGCGVRRGAQIRALDGGGNGGGGAAARGPTYPIGLGLLAAPLR